MTADDCLNKLVQFCDKEVKDSGWWIFNKRKITFQKTRILESYEKTANLKLPDKLEIRSTLIDFNGIKVGPTLYCWEDICATGLKIETVDNKRHDDQFDYENYLLFCLKDGKVIQIELGEIDKFYGLLGHFIEQYKNEHESKM